MRTRVKTTAIAAVAAVLVLTGSAAATAAPAPAPTATVAGQQPGESIHHDSDDYSCTTWYEAEYHYGLYQYEIALSCKWIKPGVQVRASSVLNLGDGKSNAGPSTQWIGTDDYAYVFRTGYYTAVGDTIRVGQTVLEQK